LVVLARPKNAIGMPELSIVIPSVNGKQFLLPCLERVEQQSIRDSIEVIVCDRLGEDTVGAVRERFPNVCVVNGLANATIPQLRWAGLKKATAPLVAMIEDHSTLPRTWSEEVLLAHRQYQGETEGVIGGPVENGTTATTFDWAFFFTEYAPLMPPMSAQKAGVAGGNVSFRRSLLPLDDDRFAGLWENHLLDELRRRGVAVRIHPGMTILHRNPFDRAEFRRQRYLFLRSIAAMRSRSWGLLRRWVHAVGAVVVLPWLLPLRAAAAVWRKRRNRRELLVSLPMMVGFLWIGIAGEVAGVLWGDGGSLAEVK
jgi:glycosyltransferase involved in cell wall biosynthesis